MPILLPFAFGGLVLTAVGLGVKRVLDEVAAPPTREAVRAHEARERHRAALDGLKTARHRLGERVRAHGTRQARVLAEVVEPFRALLARLERWEHAREAEVLSPEARDALRQLPGGAQAPRPGVGALLGAGATAPLALEGLLGWLDRGWVEESAPVVVDGVSLFEAVAVEPGPAASPEDVAHAFDAAARQLQRVTTFLDTLRAHVEALDARVAPLHTRATAQLTYLDPQSFEDDSTEPRERLQRLGRLVDALVLLLRSPVLDAEGRPVPPRDVDVPDDAPPTA